MHGLAALMRFIRHITNITWNEAGQKAGLPSSAFCKGLLALNNKLQHSWSYGASEVYFYNDIRKLVSFECPVPCKQFAALFCYMQLSSAVQTLRMLICQAVARPSSSKISKAM